jgi:hypothetical protein
MKGAGFDCAAAANSGRNYEGKIKKSRSKNASRKRGRTYFLNLNHGSWVWVLFYQPIGWHRIDEQYNIGQI